MPNIRLPTKSLAALHLGMKELEEVGKRIKDKHKKIVHPEDFTEKDKEWDFEYVPALKLFRYVRAHKKPVTISDLGLKDRHRIRKMAQIYHAYIAKKYGIEESFKDKVKKQGVKLDENIAALMGSRSVFGVGLKYLMERDDVILPYTQIPLVIKMLFDCINKRLHEDKSIILRPTNDSHTLSKVIKMMATDFYGNREIIERTLMASDLKVAGDVLIFLLKNLPHTLFTSKYVDAFHQLCKIEDEFDRLKALKLLIFQLPDANRNVLAELLAILYKISGITLRNREITTRLGELMTPILFELEDKDTSEDSLKVSPFEVTQMMVLYAELLFFVPPFMKKALKMKKIKEGRLKVSESQVKVTAAQFNTFNWGIVIDSTSVARDVLEDFFKEVQRTRSKKDVGSEICQTKSNNLEDFLKYHVLVETGGLVKGERILHEETPIVRVVRENPEVKWIVQCTH